MIRAMSRSFIVLFAVIALPASSALASDGIIEINQARADYGGVTPGDAPGYPVTISEPGSYILTSNLTIAGSDTGAILVTAERVSIDLNGFTISGPNTCTGNGASLSCTTNGTAIGIYSTSHFTSVRNGSVTGMGGNGITLSMSASVSDVVVTSNSGSGVQVQWDSIVTRVRATRNGGGAGIAAGYSSVVSDSSSRNNSGVGFLVESCVVHRASASFNGNHGFYGTGASLFQCIADSNGGWGIVSIASTLIGASSIKANDLGEISGSFVETAPNFCSGCP